MSRNRAHDDGDEDENVVNELTTIKKELLKVYSTPSQEKFETVGSESSSPMRSTA